MLLSLLTASLVPLLLPLPAAMDAFCEHLELNEVLPYVPQLVQQLLALLQGGRPGVQEMALSALASVAAAAQEAFQPYAGWGREGCWCSTSHTLCFSHCVMH